MKLIIMLLFLCTIIHGNQLFVSSVGNNFVSYTQNSIDHPWLNPKTALDSAKLGDTIVLRGGVYSNPPTYMFKLPEGKNGISWAPGQHYTIMSYPGEWAVLDGNNSIERGVWNALLGAIDERAYWQFIRLELKNGRMVNDSSARAFHCDRGPFKFSHCYFHDTYTTDYIGNIPCAISGHTWTNSIIEHCHFERNGSLTQLHHNASQITMFTDYNSWNIAIDGCDIDLYHTQKNEFRYNYIVNSGGGGIYYKSDQFFTGRQPGGNDYSDTYNTYGDKVHHNIFKDLGTFAVLLNQDFAQCYNNVIDSCKSGIASGYGNSTGSMMYKQCIYNNYIRKCTGNSIYVNEFEYNSLTDNINPNMYVWVFNNVLDSCQPGWNYEELCLSDNFTTGTVNSDNAIFVNNYSYRPGKNSYDASGNKIIYFEDTRYTVQEFLALPGRSSANLYLNQYNADNIFWKTSTGAGKYVPNFSHVLSGNYTITNGGRGGNHPYLSGVAIDTGLGAVIQSDTGWVYTVYGLQDTINLKNGYETPPVLMRIDATGFRDGIYQIGLIPTIDSVYFDNQKCTTVTNTETVIEYRLPVLVTAANTQHAVVFYHSSGQQYRGNIRFGGKQNKLYLTFVRRS